MVNRILNDMGEQTDKYQEFERQIQPHIKLITIAIRSISEDNELTPLEVYLVWRQILTELSIEADGHWLDSITERQPYTGGKNAKPDFD